MCEMQPVCFVFTFAAYLMASQRSKGAGSDRPGFSCIFSPNLLEQQFQQETSREKGLLILDSEFLNTLERDALAETPAAVSMPLPCLRISPKQLRIPQLPSVAALLLRCN